MPAITPVVLTDGTTPMTLNPAGRNGKKVTFRSSSKSTLETQAELDVTVNDSSLAQRVILKLSEPQEFTDQDTGLVAFVDTAIGEVNLRIPRSMDTAKRVAFVKRIFSANLDTAIEAVTQDGEAFWS